MSVWAGFALSTGLGTKMFCLMSRGSNARRMAARQKDRVAGSPVMYLDPEQTENETMRA